ncbi:hypothetical protein OPV22_022989 [Ensete ventricosum]|uniref:C2H2-type domain-containing protein n=1 Tax=Ensete ventricosum TaxID=4639 RepID=A0AAV8QKS4_ENSVE|nr:hypothetical protein OPV22_022989 [Ensete ventricosum]
MLSSPQKTPPHTSTSCLEDGSSSKRKRRPAGTPDPDAEVVSLSPRTLLEAERYVCEICNQGFQRDQNLQMHRRRHKVPWKLLKREAAAVRKRVFVCPEPSCLHHDPRHALGDLVGIKKHFRRKHSNHKQWVCSRCSKAYAVQSDYKAHLKTCGTRGHSCDCGRVFSRVESFIEHQDSCNGAGGLSWTASNTTPSAATNDGAPAPNDHRLDLLHNVELQLLPTSNTHQSHATSSPSSSLTLEFANARRIRQQAQADLQNAYLLRDHARKQMNLLLLQMTCHACRKQFQPKPDSAFAESSPPSATCVSSLMTGIKRDDINVGHHLPKFWST